MKLRARELPTINLGRNVRVPQNQLTEWVSAKMEVPLEGNSLGSKGDKPLDLPKSTPEGLFFDVLGNKLVVGWVDEEGVPGIVRVSKADVQAYFDAALAGSVVANMPFRIDLVGGGWGTITLCEQTDTGVVTATLELEVNDVFNLHREIGSFVTIGRHAA